MKFKIGSNRGKGQVWNLYFENSNKVDNPLVKLTKNKSEKTQIINIMNEG